MTKRASAWRSGTWRRGAARGLAAFAVLAIGAAPQVQSGPWATAQRVAQADEIDCVDDKDNFDLPECVALREAEKLRAEQAQRARDAQMAAEEQAASEQAAAAAPTGPSNPKDIVFKMADAGKEATQYLNQDGTDKYGPWARTRFERERTTSASTLGPAVIDTRAWVAKDVETARALFKEQAAIKDFPERKEPTKGPNEKTKPPKVGEESSVVTQYWQDEDNKTWQHYRFVIRNGTNVAVVYLFGREDFFADKDKKWNGQGEWYIQEITNRL